MTDCCNTDCIVRTGCTKNLKLFIWRGDSSTINITTEFDISSASNLIFTAKRSAYDLDTAALIQKTLGFGLAVLNPYNLALQFVPIDTQDLETEQDRQLVWDIQAQIGADLKTVAFGSLCIRLDITRLPVTSVPVYTYSPPLPTGVGVGDGYTHVQSTPATVWVIAHNFGYAPNVDIYDQGGSSILGTIQTSSDGNTTTITFNAPTAGQARLD